MSQFIHPNKLKKKAHHEIPPLMIVGHWSLVDFS